MIPSLSVSILAIPPLLESSVVFTPLIAPTPLATAVLVKATAGITGVTLTVNVIVADAATASVCVAASKFVLAPVPVKVGLIVAPVAVGAGTASTLNVAAPKVVVKFSTTCTLFNASVPVFLTIIVNGMLIVPLANCTGAPACLTTPITGNVIGVGTFSPASPAFPLLFGSIATAPPLLEASVTFVPLIAPVPEPVATLVNAVATVVSPLVTLTTNVIVALAPAAKLCVAASRLVFAPVPV